MLSEEITLVTFRITLEQMQEKYEALRGMLKAHQVELALKCNFDPMAAKDARSLALALVEQAHSLLDQVNSSIERMGNLEHAGNLAATIEPFLYESTVILLVASRKLVRMVNEKITQANNITARAEWQIVWQEYKDSYEGESKSCEIQVSEI